MQDLHSMLNARRRPALMMRAARIGAKDYRRSAHLPRVLGYGILPRHGAALMQLLDIESGLETQRTMSDASYSLIRHIDVLIAMIGEARELRASETAAPE